MKTTSQTPEQFASIQGYDDYVISNYGYVISTKGLKKRILAANPCGQGYRQVNLSQNGCTKFFKIHRLVAIHFLNADSNKPCINHIDGNKLNNHVDNLELCTQGENVREAIKNNLKSKMNETCGYNSARKVNIFDPAENITYQCKSLYSCAKQLEVSLSAVYNCCTGRQKTVKGFIISYAN